MLDGWEDVERIIKGTLALIQLKNSLLGNPREICSCRYQLEVHQIQFDPHCHWLAYMSHDLGGIVYVYRLKRTRVTTWAGLPMSTNWKDTSYDSILVVVDWLKKILRDEPVQITINAPALAAGYMPSNCLLRGGPYPLFQIQVGSHDCMQKEPQHGLDTSNPFPPDLWGYVHGFGHQAEDLIVPLAHYDPLKV